MEDVMFVLKCLAVTVVLVVLMQIRVGQHTVEGHAMAWVHRSAISQKLQDVAEGAVRVTKEAKNGVAHLVGASPSSDDQAPAATQASSQAAGGGWFKIKRSAAYYRQKEREQKARELDKSVDDVAADEIDKD